MKLSALCAATLLVAVGCTRTEPVETIGAVAPSTASTTTAQPTPTVVAPPTSATGPCAASLQYAHYPNPSEPILAAPLGAAGEPICVYKIAFARTPNGLPDWCGAAGIMIATRVGSTRAIIEAGHFRGLPPGELIAGSIIFTGPAGFAVLLQTALNVDEIEVSAGDRPIRLAPRSGVAGGLLAHDGTAVRDVRLELNVRTTNGAQTKMDIDFASAHYVGAANNGLKRDDCMAMLPIFHPSDEATQQHALRAVAAKLFNPSDSAAASAAVLDADAGALRALEQLRTGEFASMARGAEMSVRTIAFESADAAVLRMDLRLSGNGYGTYDLVARRIDGEWKITSASFCAFLGMLPTVRCPA